MAHPRVDQLRFARSEWQRGLVALSEADAAVRLMPMNSISWMLGHLAWHERLCWMMLGHTNLPEYVGTMPSQAHYRRDD